MISSCLFTYQEIHYRDVNIVTTLDTLTSVLCSVIIFGILGNLAHETGTDDIRSTVQGGSGLAFVSYPNAISKFTLWPQFFSILFFFMLLTLGLGIINDVPQKKPLYID